MPDFLNGFVQSVLDETVKEQYPHIRYPALVCAKVKECMVKGNKNLVTLQILAENLEADKRFPLLPYIKTEIAVQINDIVVVGLLYGGCNPYVLGVYNDYQ